ncbi:transposase [Streptomyces sp. NPDC001774]
MSLQPQVWPEIPELTARVAWAAAGRGEVPLPMWVRDELGELFADAEFAEAFGVRGRPGWSPGRLAMVTALQLAENLTDRAAAHRVRYDLSWKYCLGLELEDTGLDASVLSEFRTRVVEHHLGERALDLLLTKLNGKDLVKAGGKQRTDCTHVIAAVRELNRLAVRGGGARGDGGPGGRRTALGRGRAGGAGVEPALWTPDRRVEDSGLPDTARRLPTRPDGPVLPVSRVSARTRCPGACGPGTSPGPLPLPWRSRPGR